jgi:hypothetical protein
MQVLDLFLNAIEYNETCGAMMINFPRGEDELRDLAQRWMNVSTCPQGLFWGHIKVTRIRLITSADIIRHMA